MGPPNDPAVQLRATCPPIRILRSTAGRRSGPHRRAPVRAPASCNRWLGRKLRTRLRLVEIHELQGDEHGPSHEAQCCVYLHLRAGDCGLREMAEEFPAPPVEGI